MLMLGRGYQENPLSLQIFIKERKCLQQRENKALHACYYIHTHTYIHKGSQSKSNQCEKVGVFFVTDYRVEMHIEMLRYSISETDVVVRKYRTGSGTAP